MPTSYFDFVVSLKLHDWTTRSVDLASRKLRTTSADELTMRKERRRIVSATSGRRTSWFLDPSRIDEVLEDVEYIDREEAVSPRPYTMPSLMTPTPNEAVDGLVNEVRNAELPPEVHCESSTTAAVIINDETKHQTHDGVTSVTISRKTDVDDSKIYLLF